MPRRQPRWPSIGLASRSVSILAIRSSSTRWRSTFTPSASRRARSSIISLYSFGVVRNSCSGGSSRRIVTGSPSIARKMPTKSSRWKGSSFLTAECRVARSEEHTSELQSQSNLVCRLLLEKKKKKRKRLHVEEERDEHVAVEGVALRLKHGGCNQGDRWRRKTGGDN